MLIYSEKISHFIHEIKSVVYEVVSREVGLRVSRDRLYDSQGYSYPIKIVIYNNESRLGFFDPNFYELGFHECLMHTSREKLHAVIRHEVAHFIVFIRYGGTVQPHSAEFRTFCRQMGWGEEVYRATLSLETDLHTCLGEASSVLRKVQKLLALANSSNKHEAEQAMITSQQLLMKHNLDSTYLHVDEDQKLFLKRILKQKKVNAKMRSIAKILGTFFVSIIYKRGVDGVCLEILGTAVNIEIAEYVAGVLQYELDKQWELVQQASNLRGVIARNSFFMGVAKGYCSKIQALKRGYTPDVTQALIVIEKQLVDSHARIYPRLSSARSSANYCPNSSLLGEKIGQHLTIATSLNQHATNTQACIGYAERGGV